MKETTDTQAPAQPTTPGPEHDRLEVFAGTWKTVGPSYTEGQSNQTLRASTVPMALMDTYEWLPGGFFLVHRWDGTVGEQAFQGLEVIGYDAASRSYSSWFFDNNGNCPVYRVTEQDGIWTYTGDRQRATYVVGDGGDAMTVHWEWSRDGANWHPLCDLKSVKVQ